MQTFECQSSRGILLKGIKFTAPKKTRAVMSLVHGFGEHCGRYSDMAEALSAAGIATIALDLRGHGKSDGKRGVVRDYTEYFDDLNQLLDTTRREYPGVPHILYGHSMGGGLVLNYMLQDEPQESLNEKNTDILAVIASAPLLRLAAPVPKPLRWIIQGLTKLFPDFSISQPVKGEAVSSLPAEQEKYVQDPLNHGTLGGRLALGMIARGGASLADAESWSKPLLLMHAKADVLTDFTASETFAGHAENCMFLPFEGVAHEMHNDRSRPKVYRAMIEFIESQI